MDKIVKVYDTSLEAVNEGRREVISIINTDSVDREGEVVQPQGLKKSAFKGNPVVFLNHDYRQLPVGKNLWIKSDQTADGRSVLKAKTYISDKTELARDVFGLMQDGVLNAFSIGFQSKRASAPTTKETNARPELKGAKLIHREWELLEYSVVGIPCNPDALTLAVSKGLSKDTIDFLKAGNNAAATQQVVAATVADMHTEEKNRWSQKGLRDLLAKHIEAVTRAIDTDKVLAEAMQTLTRIAD